MAVIIGVELDSMVHSWIATLLKDSDSNNGVAIPPHRCPKRPFLNLNLLKGQLSQTGTVAPYTAADADAPGPPGVDCLFSSVSLEG